METKEETLETRVERFMRVMMVTLALLSVILVTFGMTVLLTGCTVVTPAIKKGTMLTNCKLVEMVRKDPLMKVDVKTDWEKSCWQNMNLVGAGTCDKDLFPEVSHE